MLIGLAFSLLINTAHAQDAVDYCPVPQSLAASVRTPGELRNYLTGRVRELIKTPEDLVCCMIRDRKLTAEKKDPFSAFKIVVAHHSQAAQNGDPKSPRVILYSQKPTGEIELAFSINGGLEGSEKGDAIEWMFNDGATKQLGFYDLPFPLNHQKTLSNTNPESCMQCHTGGPVGGARPLFDPSPWQRYVHNRNGSVPFPAPQCPEETELRRAASLLAIQNLKTNPRYKCISEQMIDKNSVSGLDTLLRLENHKRVATLVKITPEYNRFKYVLMGMDVCADALSWIPASRLEKMTQTAFLPRGIQQAETIEEAWDAVSDILALKNATNQNRASNISQQVERMTAGNLSEYHPDLGPTQCRYSKFKIPSIDELKKGLSKAVSDTHRKYLIAAHTANDFGMADYRFLFESRGIDIGNWDMHPTNAHTRRPFLLPHLLEGEPQALKALFDGFDLTNEADELKRSLKAKPDRAQTICNELKRLSGTAR